MHILYIRIFLPSGVVSRGGQHPQRGVSTHKGLDNNILSHRFSLPAITGGWDDEYRVEGFVSN